MQDTTKPSKTRLSILKNPIVIWPIVGGLIVFAEYWPFTRYGFLFPRVTFEVLYVVSILLILVSIIGLIPSKIRKASFRVLATCFIFIVVYVISINIGRQARYRAFAAFAERSETLVAAIKSYNAKYGEVPPSLEALLPEYLPKQSTTGMRSYPHYYYARRDVDNTWTLCVPVDSYFDWSTLVYSPSDKTSDSSVRFGDWIYRHDTD